MLVATYAEAKLGAETQDLDLVADQVIDVGQHLLQRLEEELVDEGSSDVEKERLALVHVSVNQSPPYAAYEHQGQHTLLCSAACLPIETKQAGATVKKKPVAQKTEALLISSWRSGASRCEAWYLLAAPRFATIELQHSNAPPFHDAPAGVSGSCTAAAAWWTRGIDAPLLVDDEASAGAGRRLGVLEVVHRDAIGRRLALEHAAVLVVADATNVRRGTGLLQQPLHSRTRALSGSERRPRSRTRCMCEVLLLLLQSNVPGKLAPSSEPLLLQCTRPDTR